ncbi:MAG: methyltransferase [Rhodobacteraceae bacterium]|nr:methyltransferase [Paracoccaceae bacterium]
MAATRLELALAEGPPLPATGTILVINAGGGQDLSALPRDRIRIVQGFRPDHDALAARGFAVAPVVEGRHAAAVVFVPRARAAARAAVAAAVAAVDRGAPVWVDGARTDGIEALLRELKARADLSPPVAKAHGKCAVFASPGPEALADWAAQDGHPAPGFIAPPGAFSADGIDPASALLAAALPARPGATVADLGAGWGWLAAAILAERPDIAALHLVEADHASLAAARANIADPRAVFHWADALAWRPPGALDAVVTNPPFHAGRAADPGIGIAFIRAAAGMLAPHGTLWLVANRHLPYESALAAAFRDVETLPGDGRFKLFRASHPVPRRGAVVRSRR